MEKDKVTVLWKNLTNQLSAFAIKNQVDLSEISEVLSEKISQYVKEDTLKGISDIVDIYHLLNSHEECKIKLDCNKRHCIECYYHFVCEKGLDPNNLFCTCNKQITPKIKAKFLTEYRRIQEMKVDCAVCGKRQDRMNFAVIRMHNCNVCTSCIKETFVYQKGQKNNCRVCKNQYEEECELILKDLKEITETEESKANFYKEECFLCKVMKDSRFFIEICQSRHLSCKACIDAKQKNNDNSCNCGLDISIMDNR